MMKLQLRKLFVVGNISDSEEGIEILKAGCLWIVVKNGIWEWPRSISFIEKVAVRLGEQKSSVLPADSVRWFWPAIVLRNIIFVSAILVHGFRRLAPPYRSDCPFCLGYGSDLSCGREDFNEIFCH
jgi:hypothetical protein